MKLLVTALLLTMLAPLAHADSDFEQRERLAGEREQQNAYQKAVQGLATIDADFVGQLASLGARHGGFAKSPICSSGMGADDNRTSRQACSGNFCVSVGVPESVDRFQDFPQGLLMDEMIMSCDVTLNDGLACNVYLHTPGLNVTCLDAQGNEVKTSAPAPGKKRKSVLKKKR